MTGIEVGDGTIPVPGTRGCYYQCCEHCKPLGPPGTPEHPKHVFACRKCRAEFYAPEIAEAGR